MTKTLEEEYSDEIRDWLVGRLAKNRRTGIIQTQHPAMLENSPILSWWIFEGRQYQGLEGPLAANWTIIDHQARRLLSTSNPHWRIVGTPEGNRLDYKRAPNSRDRPHSLRLQNFRPWLE